MVTTVTLSPSIDKTYIVKQMKDDVLNYAEKTVVLPGSKGINVSRLLSRLEVPNTAIGLNGGMFGPFLEDLLRREQVVCDFTPCHSDIRLNVKIVDLANGTFTDVNDQGEPVEDAEFQKFLAAYEAYLEKSEYIVLAGSLRKGMPEDTYATLIRMAQKKEVPVLLDCCGGCLKAALPAKPFLVAPNIHELEDCFQIRVNTLEQVIEYAKQIYASGTTYAIVTLGGDGAVMACRNGVYKMTPARVCTRNTTGAGDSFLAGLLYGMLRGETEEKMLKIAGSVSTAKVVREDTGIPDRETLFHYMEGTTVEKIQ